MYKQILVLFLFMKIILTQDIGYEEEEEPVIENNTNLNRRKPLYFPKKCGLNQLYYPGQNKNDWICDCRPGYLYTAATDECHQAFTQGPCKVGEHLILQGSDFIPSCVDNPCTIDGMVSFGGKCVQLFDTEVCDGDEKGVNLLSVNHRTMALECSRIRVASRDVLSNDHEDAEEQLTCPPGSKRHKLGLCPKK